MHQLSPAQLKDWLDDASKPAPVLLDVREPWEFEAGHIAKSVAMPMQTVPSRVDELSAERAYVVICHHGARSQQVAAYLERIGYSDVFNLQGGTDAWSLTVDSTLPRY